MKKYIVEQLCVFVFGGACYGLCEIVWRGYTHWTMLLLGGVCFFGLYVGQKRYSSLSLGLRCVCGGAFITSLELVFGSVVNVAFGMNVWDYSDMPLNLYGQICPAFSLAWVLLCAPALFFCSRLAAFFGHESKKYLP